MVVESKNAGKESAERSGKFKKILFETKSEIKKITWPTKKQVYNNTLIVILTILLLGVLVWTVDICLTFAVNSVFNLL